VSYVPISPPPFLDVPVRTLDSILNFVEGQIHRSTTVRVLNSLSDPGKIQEYRERLAAAMSQFEVSLVASLLYPRNRANG